MNDPSERIYWLDKPGSVDKVYWAVVAVCAALFVADAFYPKHVEFEVEHIFGAYGIYGFVCCVFLVIVAKEMRRIIMRGEDFYHDGKPEAPDAGE